MYPKCKETHKHHVTINLYFTLGLSNREIGSLLSIDKINIIMQTLEEDFGMHGIILVEERI